MKSFGAIICKSLILPLWEWKNRRHMRHYLSIMEETQWLTEEKLSEFQWEKLKKLLNHCAQNVPYYRKLFSENNIDVSKINSSEDLQRIPLLSKKILRRDRQSEIIAQDKLRTALEVQSSGSTGTPVSVWIARETQDWHKAVQIRARRWWNIEWGEMSVWLWGRIEDKSWWKRLREHILENKWLFHTTLFSPETVAGYFSEIRKLNPIYLYGFASSLYHFARLLEQKKIAAQELKLKLIISTAEILYPYQRRLIEEVFGCSLANEYGASEVQVVAFECPKGRMHLMSDSLFIEFLDQGKPAGPNVLADIVVTDLNNFHQPIVRYALGDRGMYLNERCSCGRTLPLMDIKVGRELDMVILEDGRLMHPEIFTPFHLSPLFSKLEQFRVTQHSLRDFTIELITREENQEEIIRSFSEHIAKEIGREVKLNFQFVQEITPEASGKRRYFISKLIQTK